MKQTIFVLFSALILQSLMAEEMKDFGKDRLNSSPRHADWIDIKSGNRTLKAFVVYPERKDKAPAVLVITEIFGLTDWVRSLCDELAENGVIAIAPDLHSGQKLEDLDAARKATSALPKEQVKSDLNATADYALKIPACNGTLAVCGFCWGGGWAFEYAHTNPKVKAAMERPTIRARTRDVSPLAKIGNNIGMAVAPGPLDSSPCHHSGRPPRARAPHAGR